MATDTQNTTEQTAQIVRTYFEAVERNERGAQQRHYGPGATGTIHGQLENGDVNAIAGFFADVYQAFPDWQFKILDLIAQDDRAAVRWRATGTFAGPGSFQGFEPTGGHVEVEGMDLVRVADGAIARIDAYSDGMTIARGLGVLPPAGSPTEARMATLANRRTRMARMIASGPEQIADGVWIVRGGFPLKTFNVYLVRDGDGVLAFDAGIKAMTNAVRIAAAQLGGLTRVVLGHAHGDHRGSAPGLGVPVFCHPADKVDAEGDGGEHYFDFKRARFPTSFVMPRLLKSWDGGPVKIDGTVEEGDEIAGFRVIHLPGHAPGQIGLWRESDRFALVTDCFYTLNPETGRKGHPRLPLAVFNQDTEQARASIRKLAAMEPAAAWPGHADPVTGDVRAQLEHAADTT